MFQQAFVHNRTELFHLIDFLFSQVCQQKQPPEVFNEKKVFLKISQNSQENTYQSLFFNKVAGETLHVSGVCLQLY